MKVKSMSWFPFYVNDWLGSMSVKAMSNEQLGIFISLLVCQWNHDDCKFPEDIGYISGLCKADLTDPKNSVVLSKFKKDGGYYNEKLRDIWEVQQDKYVKMSEGGHKGGLKGGFKRGSNGSPPQPEPYPEPDPYPKPESDNKHIVGFDEVWKLYPDKAGRTRAEAAYIKAIKSGVTKERIAEAIQRYIQYVEARRKTDFKDLKYKNGGTWFHQSCWNDEYTPPPVRQAPRNCI
jgi:hypothetical protein